MIQRRQMLATTAAALAAPAIVERANAQSAFDWKQFMRPYIADGSLTSPDFDLADFSVPSMKVATGEDSKINALPLNQDLFILIYNKELLAAKGYTAPPRTYDELYAMAKALTDPGKQVYGFVGRGLKNANVVLYDNILLATTRKR